MRRKQLTSTKAWKTSEARVWKMKSTIKEMHLRELTTCLEIIQSLIMMVNIYEHKLWQGLASISPQLIECL